MLLFTLALVTVAGLAVSIDWGLPLRWYQGYQQVQAVTRLQGEYDDTLKAVKEQFGETAGYVINVSVDQDGKVIRTLSATRQCGDMDDTRFLAQVTDKLHSAGLPWPDKVEYVYSCNFSRPASMGMVVPILAKGVARQLKADTQCGDVRAGSLAAVNGYWQQSLYVHDGALDMRLYVGKSGDAERVQLVAWTQMMAAETQQRLLLCAARALVDTVAPDQRDDAFGEKLQRVWQRGKSAATSVRVGGYQIDTQAEPLELNVYSIR